MTIGKREQIVIGIILAIITVAVLHMTIFAQRQAALTQAKNQYDEASAQVAGMSKAPSKAALEAFTSGTQVFLTQLQQGMSQFGMEERLEFEVLDREAPDYVPKMLSQFNEQIDLVILETDRLAHSATIPEPRLSFLAPGAWALPTDLPSNIPTATLWDMLNKIADIRGLLDSATAGTAMHTRTQGQYDALLQQIGLDPRKLEDMKRYGEFVPVYYEVQMLNLILSRIPEGEVVLIRGNELDRWYLMTILNIELPAEIEHVGEGRGYFLYQFVHYVNLLVEMARQHGVLEVSDVKLWGQAYLRKAPDTKPLPDMAVQMPDALPDDLRLPYNYLGAGAVQVSNPLARGPQFNMLALLTQDQIEELQDRGFTMEQISYFTPSDLEDNGVFLDADLYSEGGFGLGLGGGRAATQVQVMDSKPREDEDIGYAFPIQLTFRSSNKDGWAFIYDMLNQSPLTELYRVSAVALSTQRPSDPNIEFTVTFLFVPKLFKTVDTVRQLLKELEGPPPAGI
jgi:hypothetical protein